MRKINLESVIADAIAQSALCGETVEITCDSAESGLRVAQRIGMDAQFILLEASPITYEVVGYTDDEESSSFTLKIVENENE